MTTHTRGRVARQIRVGAALAGAAFAALAFAAPASAAEPNLISNGDFSAPNIAADADGFATYCADITASPNCVPESPSIGPWTVTDGSVDLYNNEFLAPPVGDPSTTQSIDINGNEAATLSQTFTPPVGQQVLLSFMVHQNVVNDGVCGPAVKTLHYGIGDHSNTVTYDPAIDDGWVPVTFTAGPFTDSTPTTVEFSSDLAGFCGAVIADVSVTAVPEVGAPMVSGEALGAIGGGAALLLGGAYLLRRRRRPAPQPTA